MQIHSSNVRQTYTGEQLRSGWILDSFDIEGDAVVAFRGPCDVAREHMIDLEDLAANDTIVAADMLHFIAEHGDGDLGRAVLRQRLLVCCILEELLPSCERGAVVRDGDDLFVTEVGDDTDGGRRKLSVSIATTSAAGTTLIHTGINVDPSGAPVPAIGLAELGVDPDRFAANVLARYAGEMKGAAHAQTKVREAP